MKTDINGYYDQNELDELAPTIMIAKKIEGQQFDILEYHKNYSSSSVEIKEIPVELGYKSMFKYDKLISADEMFDSLGYRKDNDNPRRYDGTPLYRNLYHSTATEMRKENEHIIFYEKTSEHSFSKIIFDKDNKEIIFENLSCINMNELRAINIKCIEMGWFDERRKNV